MLTWAKQAEISTQWCCRNAGHFSASSSVFSVCDLLKPPGLALAMRTWKRVVGTLQAGALGTQPNLKEARRRLEQTRGRETGLDRMHTPECIPFL